MKVGWQRFAAWSFRGAQCQVARFMAAALGATGAASLLVPRRSRLWSPSKAPLGAATGSETCCAPSCGLAPPAEPPAPLSGRQGGNGRQFGVDRARCRAGWRHRRRRRLPLPPALVASAVASRGLVHHLLAPFAHSTAAWRSAQWRPAPAWPLPPPQLRARLQAAQPPASAAPTSPLRQSMATPMCRGPAS